MLDIGPGIAALGASLITGIVTLLAAMRVARMNINAAQYDRIWDSRKPSYTAILATLRDASEKADLVDNRYNSGEDGYEPHDYFVSAAREKDEAAARRAWARCKSEFDVNRLILSDSFLARFESLLGSLPTAYDAVSPPRDAARWAECLRDAYADLLSLARREMLPPQAGGREIDRERLAIPPANQS